MICFDIEDWSFEYFEIFAHNLGLGAFAYDGNNFWIMKRGEPYEKVIKWNNIRHTVVEFKLSHDLVTTRY